MDKTDLNLNWEDVTLRAGNVTSMIKAFYEDNWSKATKRLKLYGIPHGGIYAAQLVREVLYNFHRIDSQLTETEIAADIFIDDIVDLGVTRDRYKKEYPNIPFLALVDKLGRDSNLKQHWIVFPWERMIDKQGPEENIVRILQYIGEDATREGLKETPKRVIKSYEKLFGGYKVKPQDIIKTFKEDTCDEMVLVKNIEFYSTCEHHMLPFFGKAHIAYIPDGELIGVSKLAHLLEIYARRLQIQERLGQQITEVIDNMVKPLGAACILEAQHFCMTSRGVQKQNSIMITSSLTGVFKNSPEARAEFLSMIGYRK
jgi:GTP cyclohydrolase I